MFPITSTPTTLTKSQSIEISDERRVGIWKGRQLSDVIESSTPLNFIDVASQSRKLERDD